MKIQLGILFSVIIFFSVRSVASQTAESCKTIPFGRNRHCAVTNSSLTSLLKHVTVHLSWHEEDCTLKQHVNASECPGYVGMMLSFECQIDGTYVYSVQKNRSMGRPNITFNELQPEDAGQYQCRLSIDNKILSTYNITVSTEVALGLGGNLCLVSILYNSTHSCCDIGTSIRKSQQDESGVITFGPFYAFGTDNVSLQHYWITPAQNHHPTDVGLILSKPIKATGSQFDINITQIPKKIEVTPTIMAVIGVSKDSLSRSLCVPIKFEVGQSFSSNDSLPLNVTTAKGNNATFECELGTFYRNDYSDHYTFHYSLVSQDNNTSIPVWNRTCRAGEVPHYCWTADGSDEDYVLSITTTQKEEASVKFRFNFQVSNVDTKHNNSVFSCAILSAGQIQWLHTAHLTVTAMKERSSQQDAHTMVMVIVISIMVLLVVSGAALVLTGVIMLAKRKWKRRRIGELESDRVPLTTPNGVHPTLCDSEASTPVADQVVADNINGPRNIIAPAIHIVDCGNSFMSGMVVGESLPVSSEGDQGYQSSSQSDDTLDSIGCQLKAMVENERRRRRTPPNTLGLSGSNHSKSNSYLTDTHMHSKVEVEPADNNLTWHENCAENCAVYISYTERMAYWVREYLKPLIESWRQTEVLLHEDDMIPGFTIPGERQRLILEAHKVVLVVSRDYSESPWCLYELQHAIQQEPALCHGRIIPILVDGCDVLPSIVRGVVALTENDRNFNMKLKKNITGHC